jgi:hypothetical protein
MHAPLQRFNACRQITHFNVSPLITMFSTLFARIAAVLCSASPGTAKVEAGPLRLAADARILDS